MSQRGRALQEIEGENVFPCYTITCLFPSSSYVRGDAWWMPWVVGLGSSAWLAIMLEIEATHIECWFPNNQQLNNRFLRDSMWEFEQAPSKAKQSQVAWRRWEVMNNSTTVMNIPLPWFPTVDIPIIFQWYSDEFSNDTFDIPYCQPSDHARSPLCILHLGHLGFPAAHLCVALSILDMHMTYMNTYN